jgi:hypothetical protein
MSDLLLFLSAGTFGLARRDRFVALILEAYRRWPMLRRIPILGRGTPLSSSSDD